jgi:hypothetical protein
MNEILKQMRGEVLVRMDVHADYAEDYVRRCVEVLERTAPTTPAGGAGQGHQLLQRAVCAALASRSASAARRTATPTTRAGSRPCSTAPSAAASSRRSASTTPSGDQRGRRAQPAHPRRRRPRLPLARHPDLVLPAQLAVALARQYFKYGHGRRGRCSSTASSSRCGPRSRSSCRRWRGPCSRPRRCSHGLRGLSPPTGR